nr:SLOG family protein [uncultured Oscillibacter sp.]
MTERELRQHRCCFTGHRPEKLEQPEPVVVEALKKEICTAIADGFQTFISGMARGVDLWAAVEVLTLRDEGAVIRLICASPYRGFENRWSRDWQEKYRWVVARADLVRFICPSYSRGCFQRRNEWMIDHSARVIAVYSGGYGGTRNTVEYARGHGVPVKIL